MQGMKRSGKRQGDEDFEPFVWHAVCNCMQKGLTEDEVEMAQQGYGVVFSNTTEDHSRITKAFEDFKTCFFVSVRERDQRDSLNRQQFLKIFHRHIESFYRFGHHLRRTRHVVPKLTPEEEVVAARILASKHTVKGKEVFFRTALECASVEHKDRMKFAALLFKAEVTPEYFGRKLLAKHPEIIGFGKVDMQETFAPATLQAREYFAAQLRGEEIWRISQREGPRGGKPPRQLYWKPDNFYLRHFVVMWDGGEIATSKAARKHSSYGFFSQEVVQQPEECRRADDDTRALTLKFYIAIHPDAPKGIASGPHITYYGSRSHKGKARSERHDNSVNHW